MGYTHVLSTDRMAKTLQEQLKSTEREECVSKQFKGSGRLFTGRSMGGAATAFWTSARGKVRMCDMDDDFLQKAFESVCYSEIQLHNALEHQIATKDKLLKEAYSRGLDLKYPDEVKQKDFGYFFKADRLLRKILQFAFDRQRTVEILRENAEKFMNKTEKLKNKWNQETQKNQSV